MARIPTPPAFWLATCAALAMLALALPEEDPPMIADLIAPAHAATR